jgi:predicted nucleotidyltransferase/HEPN domain-containing protein
VVAHHPDALGEAQLTAVERRVVERLLALLERELGDELLAVWLYGSRARGEADLTQTGPDTRSDVDLMVIVAPAAADWDEMHENSVRLANEAADAEGDDPVWYSVLVYDAEWLRDRREIRSFFIQEVDRDKVVLMGSPLEEHGAGDPAESGRRSEEFLAQARERLAGSRRELEAGHLAVAVGIAHDALLSAARARLSEDDEPLFTLPQTAREQGDYEAAKYSEDLARSYVEGADRFIAETERMLNG